MSTWKRVLLFMSGLLGGVVSVGLDLKPAAIYAVVALSACVFFALLNRWWVER